MTETVKAESSLAELRAEIARTTKEIVRLVGRRNQLAQEVGMLKSKASLPAEDEAVEDALLKEVVSECDRAGLSRTAGFKIFQVLLEESKKAQGLRQTSSPMASFAKAVALQRQGVKVIRLDVGEPDFRPPRRVLIGCANALYGFKTHYTGPRGIPELTTALREYIARKQRFEVASEEVMATPSGRFAVYAALACTVGEGESAVVIEPNWPAYREILASLHARPLAVRTQLGDAWNPSLEEIKDAIRPNTKAIVLSYPNNPTGNVITPSLFREIVELADDRDLTVISDEIYNEYSYRPCPSILDKPPERFVLTASFSKTWAMTGFRVGYAVSSRETIASMAKIASLTVTSIPEFIQYGAIEALNADSDVRRNVRTMKERIDAVAEALGQIDSLEYLKPDGAMYYFPELKGYRGTGEKFADHLLNKGVSVTPGSSFGEYPKFFRISLGQPKEVLLEGVKRMGELLV
ncbi:MAG: aminotransferase class I/II-fold pyridoxal phosphate-dependent enzyme [Thaumarchaeota archaeon]|nr:aminotransferase class I/II-fold pyridoxal phosphate-dependent enzyme [Nitrososphaerota archaeon]